MANGKPMTANGASKSQLAGVQAYFPPERIPQPDGAILIRPGKAVITTKDASSKQAADFLGLSIRTISYQCEIGVFKTAYKPGGRPRSPWRISWSEVNARKNTPSE